MEIDEKSEGSIIPLSLGIISEPPCLILFYDRKEHGSTAKKKRRKRKIPLRQFTDKSNVERFAQNVRIRHGEYLENVPHIVIEKMLRIIQEIIQGHNADEAAVRVHAEYAINPNEDLNKLPQDEVNRKKMIMDEIFEKNRLRPTDPGYEYDKQVDFSSELKVKSGWDEDDDCGEEKESGKTADDDGTTSGGEKDNVGDQPEGEDDDKIETYDANDEEDYFW